MMTIVQRSYGLRTIGQIFTLKYYTLASIVILYYDHLLTFPTEVCRIWRRQLTLSSVLFLVNRYIVFGGYIFVLYLGFFPPDDTNFCRMAARVRSFLSLLTQIVTSILLSLRTYALYNRSWKLLCFMSLLGLSTIITSAWTIDKYFGILFTFGNKGDGGMVFWTCGTGQVTNINLFLATISLSTVFDGVMFILTVAKTLQIVRQNRKAGARADLPNLLMRDGSIYFAAMTVTNLVNLIMVPNHHLPSTEFAQSTGNNAVLSHVISVTMISRLVLNLHGFEDRKRNAAVRIRQPPQYTRRDADSAEVDDTTCEVSFTGEAVGHETSQLTTQISLYSTWISRAMDGLEGDMSPKEKGVLYSSSTLDTSATTAITESSSEHDSSRSTHYDEESAWFDEEESNPSERPENLSLSEIEDERPGVRRFSKGSGVWWKE